MMSFRCAWCNAECERRAIDVKRARERGLNLYCDRKCSGLARRRNKTKAQLVHEKRLYDLEYRKRNLAMLKAKKAAYFKRTYDPVQAAIYRKSRMPRHVEYCRQPKYKLWKQAYDAQYRAKKYYGPFAEAAMLTADLNREIKERASNHDIKWQNKTANKSQFRAREAKEEKRSRPRYRERRRYHQAAIS